MKLRRYLLLSSAVVLVCLTALMTKISFNFAPEVDGFIILKGENGKWLEFTDDLVPEDASRYIWGMPLYPFKAIVESKNSVDTTQPYIDFKWDKTHGRGFIRNHWPDGRKLLINLGRFKDSNGKYPSGLFIGGGLPPSDPDYKFMNNEATGMTYYNGQHWYHIWCNSNEGMISPAQPFKPSYPTDWIFKGSWIRENDGRNLTIESRHSIMLNGQPLESSRFIFYTAGNSYAILSVSITNSGSEPVPVQYMYGDEPWIGYFGSSAGDVGWMEKELIQTERYIDPHKHSYFGMFDYGNELAGEGHTFTNFANFLEWPSDSRPNFAYISNYSGGVNNPEQAVPLAHTSNRFIGLQYGPYLLQPGKTFGFTLAIGMADNDPKTGFPVKPKTIFDR